MNPEVVNGRGMILYGVCAFGRGAAFIHKPLSLGPSLAVKTAMPCPITKHSSKRLELCAEYVYACTRYSGKVC
jgi:hypothetical protein